MTDREIAKYAALIAAGVLTEDALLEQLGDDSIVSKIMAVSGAMAITTAAKDVVEDTVDVAMDVVDSINPFKW